MSGVHQELEYRTIREISARGYSVKEICEILGVSRSGYYKWTNRKRSERECENEQLLRELRDIYHAHNGTYGYRRLTDEFNCSHGTNYNVKRIHRLTKAVGLQAVIRRTKPNYRKSTPEVAAENVLGRDFTTHRPNEKWLSDVTEMKYGNAQRLYLSAIMDLNGRDIVSYVIRHKNNNSLVFDTFDQATAKYPDAHPIFHSDRGFQYTNRLFRAKLDAAGMTQSMSRVGRCIDNGPMEGFWGILKCEMYHLNRFETYGQLKAAIEKFIYYYNHQRRQRKLNCMAPAEYRRLMEKFA